MIGGTTRNTLDIISICRPVVIIASKTPGYRRTLLQEEILTAIKYNKQIIALLEEGTILPLKLPVKTIIIYYNPQKPETITNNIIKLLKNKRETTLAELLTAIIISLLIALGITVLIEIIHQLIHKNDMYPRTFSENYKVLSPLRNSMKYLRALISTTVQYFKGFSRLNLKC